MENVTSVLNSTTDYEELTGANGRQANCDISNRNKWCYVRLLPALGSATAGCQDAFRNGDSHSRFPRSRHILRVTQTSTPSTRFHKSLVGITSVLQRSVCDVHICQETWAWLH